MTSSLRGRLFVGLTAVILLAGCISGAFSYLWAFDEAIEMQDSVLIQVGSLLQSGSVKSDQTLRGVDADAEVDVVELGTAPRGRTEEGQLWSLQDGLHVASFTDRSMRVLLRTRLDGSRFAVLQPTDVRDDIAGNMALRTLLPITALIPCLLLVTALVIARSLRPMVRLAGDLDSRRVDDMTPLPLAATPSELQPFIASINGLLQRMKLLMDQQRRFVADAAHELRTPITALGLQAENLDSVDLPESARERVAALKEGMARTKHLLEQLLALARHEAAPSGDAVVVPLDRIVKDVVADVLPETARKGIDLGFELIEPIATAGEPVMIATMVRNLIDNAVRFTPPGGRVDIGVLREGSEAVLQIEDTGPGVAPDDIDRIFEPFFRGSRPTEDGTGLGLSIVKRIVDRLGGSVVLENISGPALTGLRAIVRLPAANSCSASIRTHATG
ncbi:two-component system, OmpR family, sensor kinase [Bradyrhizobium lablabi]|jgi:two-component system OmpR family sensor kinase|uniref:histidine kinase n=2 Tax=Bradyrhizobium TaxID=374 RepID=A0ABY0P8J5_9BRAD|nr:two-component system, OmpR family, sensor kinase [Bradyrhizobium ottawaense]SEE15013.1 two-component system, OmpR family, sensor kinase [Bradyrhizobium lablabi]SHM11193.1 two-component system, OmpR family, sensor kinase [Bradyrhizobium lablabi]